MANFVIKRVYARFVSQTAPPVFKVGCEFEGEEKLAMLELSIYKNYVEVFGAFQMADVDLMTVEMSPAMLTEYVLGLPDKPLRAKLIASWGLQKDGIFIMANAAFDTATGLLLRLGHGVQRRRIGIGRIARSRGPRARLRRRDACGQEAARCRLVARCVSAGNGCLAELCV